MQPTLRGVLLVVPTLAILAGCQTVPPRPLIVSEQLDSLRRVDLSAEPVLTFANRLQAERESAHEPFDPADGLSLTEAEAIALWFNPEAALRRLEAERAAHLAGAAARWDDPGFDGELGRKREEIDGGALERSWIRAGALSVTIPLSGRPAAERKARSAEHGAALAAAAAGEIEALRDLRHAWLEWSAGLEGHRLLKEHVTLLERFTTVSKSLAEAGELDPGTARMFSIELARKRAQRDSAFLREGALRTAILEVAGLAADVPLTLHPTLALPAGVGLDESGDNDLTRHPEVALALAEYEAAEARLQVEIRKQYPDLVVSPGYGREGGESTVTVGLGLLPLPLWDRNNAGIAGAVADRDLARAQADSALRSALARHAQAESQAESARALSTGLSQGAVPEADQQMTEALALLEVGEVDLSLVFQALTQAYEIKEELLSARLEEQRAVADLAALHFLPEASPSPVEEAP